MTTLRRLLFSFALGATSIHAAVPRDFAVDLAATVSDTAPCIVLSWTQRVQSNITQQNIYRRLKGETTWVKLASLTATNTSYTDSTALPGVEYEYWMERKLSLTPSTAMGYVSAGVKVPVVESRGMLLLVVDDMMAAPLEPEITQLKDDLAADGWTVQQIIAPRTGTVIGTKALIKAAYDANPANVKMLYILGHVPVPYSGQIAPDGHSNHLGAWAADCYYGDMNGSWTDTVLNVTSADDPRNDNVPGDGKFDQSTIPGLVELQVGRVDMEGLGRSPTAVDATIETTLLRRYLNKAHNYRHKLGPYASIPRRTLIRDGFGHFGSSEPFAVSAWAGAFTTLGTAAAAPIDEAPDGQWFSPSYAGGQSYLWGFGCGAGSYESALSLGNSIDFGHRTSRVVFTSLFGSFSGDWDSDNNLMRSIIAGNPSEDSLALSCFWQGRPNWFVHPLGMGETLGYIARLTQNAGLSGGGGYTPLGSGSGQIHIGLMGDPALRIAMVEPPRKLTGKSASGQIVFGWAASPESGLQGYHVYRAATPDGPFTRLTAAPLSETSYTDTTTVTGNTYTYLVRTLKLESAPGGSYYNLSIGSPITLTASGAATPPPSNPSGLTVVSQTSAVNAQISWQDNSADETGFRIERRVNAAGSWNTLATVAANTTSFIDAGPFTPLNTYFYRVVAANAAGDSIPSNTASFEASAGFVEFTARTMTSQKTAGTASVTVTRFGGGTGSVTITYGTGSSTATADTHFTATSGTLSWVDGEVGDKVITVPLTDNGSPQQARSFPVYLYTPGGGMRKGSYTATNMLIEDSTGTLPWPWAQAVLGSVVYASPAVNAEGFIGSTMIGGAFSGSNDQGRFVYQARSGDDTMTAYVPATTPFSYGARVALVVRESLASNSRMAGVATGGSDYGTKLVYRTGANLVEAGANPAIITPCWIQISRQGTTFTAKQSADGVAWTTLSQVVVSGMPDTAYWGIFNCASGVTAGDSTATFQLSGAGSVSFANPTPPQPVPVPLFTASNQTITIDGGVDTSAGQYWVGNTFNTDTLEIINGGSLTMTGSGVGVGYLTLGELSGDINNTITIDGAGSRLSFTGGYLYVGSRSTGNTVTVSNGGALNGGNWGTLLASNGGGHNSVTITGAGSTWTTAGVNINGGSSNSVSVLAGGAAYSSGVFRIGNAGGSNTVTVSGSGSLLREDDELLVSTGNLSNNVLMIGTGGTVTLRDTANTGKGVVINSTGTGNKVQIDGGALTVVSTGTSTPALNVKSGALILNSGSVTTERLLANTGVTSVVTLNGGTLDTQGTTIANGAPFTVGNGTSAATLILNGGTHSFANGLVLAANATIAGTGAITSGNLIVPSGAILSPGDASSPQGFFSAGSVTLGGALAVSLSGTASNRLVCAGDLTLSNGAGINCSSSPVTPNSYIIVSYTGALNGTFASGSAPAGYQFVYDTVAKQVRLEPLPSGFSNWIGGFGLAPADQALAADPDHDGIVNGVEYILGGDPTIGGEAAKLPQASVSGGSFIFAFDRVVSSETSDISLVFQYGTDLVTWTDLAVDTANPPAVTIARSGDGLTDRLVIMVPMTGPKFFGRIKVVPNVP